MANFFSKFLISIFFLSSESKVLTFFLNSKTFKLSLERFEVFYVLASLFSLKHSFIPLFTHFYVWGQNVLCNASCFEFFLNL